MESNKTIVDENWNPIESLNKQKEKQVNLTNEFVKDYYYSKNPDKKVSFLNEIHASPTLLWENKSDLKVFLEINKEKYKWFDLEKLTISDIKRVLSKDIHRYRAKRKSIKSLFLSKYDKLDSIYDTKISCEIDELNYDKLIELNNSEKNREKFLKSILWETDVLKLDSRTLIFDKLWILAKDLTRIKELDEKHEWKISNLLLKLNEWININWIWTHCFNALQDLFELDFFDYEYKKRIIIDYFPIVSLHDLEIFWIITPEKLIDEKKRYINENYTPTDIVNIWEQVLLDSLDNEDIILDTKAYLDSNTNIDKIITNVWYIITKRIKDSYDLSKVIKIKDLESTWPQNFKELKQWLELINKEARFKNLEKFTLWNTLKFIETKADGIIDVSYLKVIKIDDEKKELTYSLIWSNQSGKEIIDPKLISVNEATKSYLNIFEVLKKWNNITLECLSDIDLKAKINNPDDLLEESDFVSYNKSDLENSEEKQKIKDLCKAKLEKQLEELNAELTANWGKPEDNPLLTAKIKETEKKLNDLGSIEWDELLWFINLQKLIEKLDEFDTDWVWLGLEKWLVLETDKWSYEVVWINYDLDNWKIENSVVLKSATWLETLSFEDFYQAFKVNKAKRVNKIKDFWELIKSFEDTDDKKYWDDHEFKDGKLIAKDVQEGDEKWDREVEFFISEKSDEIIKINSISWNTVSVQFWERKTTNNIDKKDKYYDKDWKWEVLYIDDKTYTLTLNELKKYLSDNNLHPSWQAWKTVKTQSPDELHNKFKWSFFTRLFANNVSIAELISWWKMFFESIQETLKKWNDLHAAKVALAMWSFLPEEIRADLQIKVERAESEEMDKALEWLGKVDSPIAVWRIKKWLLNKDTAEYKKEAWLLFMLEKYGHLTSKWPLYPYRWKFLWYEAFWWRVNDELFLEIKKLAEKDDVTFSEEYLMHIFLKRQCSWTWFKLIKRRSRLHKEFENKWKSGKDAEFEKGYKDASGKRTAETITKEGMDEAKWWTTSNAIGWFKKAVERWWSMENMNEWFFCLLYSWALYDVDQATFMLIKWLWDGWMPVVMAWFSTKKSEMDLFNKTVLELSKRIKKEYWDEYPDIEKEAQKLYDDAINWRQKIDEKTRLERAQEFWKNYWKPLSRALNMNHTDSIDTAKTDKIIFLEKETNSVFKEYYNKIKNGAKWWNFKEDFMKEDIWMLWIWWLNVYEVTKEYIEITTGWGLRREQSGWIFWDMLVRDIESTKLKVEAWWMDKELAKRYIIQTLKEFVSAILDRQWWRKDIIKEINAKTSKMWPTLNKWGLNIYDNLWEYNSEIILKTTKSDHVFKRVAENILSWNFASIWEQLLDPFERAADEVKKKTQDTVSQDYKYD